MNSEVRARIDADIKAKANANFKAMGVDASTAIRSLMYCVAETGEMSYRMKVPNATTLRAMKELDEGGGKSFDNIEALIADLND